jgi:hypothetical protein
MGKPNSTLKNRYEDTWSNVHDDCMLCEMNKRTKWYLETKRFVVAEKLNGGPFVVLKEHRDTLTPSEWDQMEHIVGLLFDEFEIDIRMNLVPDHWHGHILSSDGSSSITSLKEE